VVSFPCFYRESSEAGAFRRGARARVRHALGRLDVCECLETRGVPSIRTKMYQTLDDSFCDREMKERRFDIQEVSKNGTGQCWVIAKPSDHLSGIESQPLELVESSLLRA